MRGSLTTPSCQDTSGPGTLPREIAVVAGGKFDEDRQLQTIRIS